MADIETRKAAAHRGYALASAPRHSIKSLIIFDAFIV
jgi:hypothetical protein